MIDEINYFPERDNYRKKKKPLDDWKELKNKKLFPGTKKPASREENEESVPPPDSQTGKEK